MNCWFWVGDALMRLFVDLKCLSLSSLGVLVWGEVTDGRTFNLIDCLLVGMSPCNTAFWRIWERAGVVCVVDLNCLLIFSPPRESFSVLSCGLLLILIIAWADDFFFKLVSVSLLWPDIGASVFAWRCSFYTFLQRVQADSKASLSSVLTLLCLA